MSKLNFRAPFKSFEGRDDLFIYFRTSDMAELEEAYGVGAVFQMFEQMIIAGSTPVLLMALKHGLKHDVDGKAVPIMPFDMEELPFSAEAAYAPVMDAFCLQTKGLTYSELYAKAQKLAEDTVSSMETKQEVEEGEDSPFTASEASNDTSSSPIEQD